MEKLKEKILLIFFFSAHIILYQCVPPLEKKEALHFLGILLNHENSLKKKKVRYVSPSGSDLNSGLSPRSPFRNIQKAIDDLGYCGNNHCKILVEEGFYSASAYGSEINVKVGISLEGGYLKNTNYNVRDPINNPSIIGHDPIPSHCNPNSSVFCIAMRIDQDATKENTTIDGFRIISSPSNRSYGFYTDGGVRISNSEILAGLGIGMQAESVGISSSGKDTLIESSKIYGGGLDTLSHGSSIGILLSNFSESTVNYEFINVQVFSGGCGQTNQAAKSIGMKIIGNPNATINILSPSINDLHIDTQDCVANFSAHQTIGIEFNTNLKISNANIRAGNAGSVSGIMDLNGGDLYVGENGKVSIVTGNSTGHIVGIQLGSNSSKFIYNTELLISQTINQSSPNLYGILHPYWGRLVVENSKIEFIGFHSGSCYGIYTKSNDPLSKISRNKIKRCNTNGTPSDGIVYYGTEGTIENNLIYGGSAGNIRGIIIGHFNTYRNIKIYYNTITSGNSPYPWSAVPIFESDTFINSNVNIQNNLLLNDQGSTCIRLFNIPNSNTGSIRGNVYSGCSTLIFNSNTNTNYTTICPGGYLGTTSCSSILENLNPKFSQNQLINPQLVSPHTAPFDLQFTSATPCSVRRITNVISGIQSDYLRGPGHPQFPVRPTPGSPPTVSVGAFEDPGNCP